MEKKNGVIVIFGLTVIIGFFLSIQINSIKSSELSGLVPVTRLNAYMDELKTKQEERKDANHLLLEYEEKIGKIEKEQTAEDTYLRDLVKDLELYKMESGVLDVKGPGLLVTIKEPAPDGGDYLEPDEDEIIYVLIELVNKLKSGGAEAISINGQRVLATTDISFVGDDVEINAIPVAPPYFIRAIGDPSSLGYVLNIKYGIIDQIRRQYSFQVDIKEYDTLTIHRYSKEIKYRYAKPVD